jgi:hypothetical protein
MAKPHQTSAEQPARHEAVQPAAVRRDEAIRLELLRLVWRPDRDADTAIKAATTLEAYVIGKAPE